MTTPPETTPPADEAPRLRETITALQADNARLAKEKEDLLPFRAQLEERTKAFAALETKLGEVSEQFETASGELTGYRNREKEGKVLAELRKQAPHADEVALHGAFLKLVEDNKVERYPDDPTKTAAKAVEELKLSAPGLFRAPVSGGGTPPANTGPSAKRRGPSLLPQIG